MSTSTHLPLCVYCGTARSADETRCPQCGRPWIDVRVGSLGEVLNEARVPAVVGATSADAGTTVDDRTVGIAAGAAIAASAVAADALTADVIDDTPTSETATDTPPIEDTAPAAASSDTAPSIDAPHGPVEDTTLDDTDDTPGLAAASLTDTTLDDTSGAPSAPITAEDGTIAPPPLVDADEETPPTDPSQRFVWLIPALIAGAAVIVVALFGFGVIDNESEPTTTPEPVAAPVPTTAATTTTTQAPTTTAAPTTTTTSTTIPTPASIESVGNAIPMSSLTLKAGGIGPLVIGDGAPDALGRLVASLGRPEEIGVANEEMGLCAGQDGRFVRWAGLTVVVAGTLEEGAFAGYRFEEQAVPTMHLDLATPSGLRVGDPISALNEIYATYQIDYVSDAGTAVFLLSDGEGLLLWGPVSSIEGSGRVEGIHSPDACAS